MSWLEFLLAWIVFFITHSLPIRPPLRPLLQAKLGGRGFTLTYSILSLAALVWLISAASRAPAVFLWFWSPWQNYVPLIAMFAVCLILALAIGRPNPFSFGGSKNELFDPSRAGIIRWTRHPLLLAMTLWAATHLVPNGDLAHVLLFGAFAAFAGFGGHLVDRRKKREMGTHWAVLGARMNASIWHAKPMSSTNAIVRIVCGCLLYVTLIWLHPFLFGVNPIG